MTTSPQAQPPALGERITVTLIPKAEDDLRRLQERTNLSKTDLANRAITLYEFFDAQLRAGRDLIARDSGTGETHLVHLVDAPAAGARPDVSTRSGTPGHHRGRPRRPLRPLTSPRGQTSAATTRIRSAS